MANTYRDYFDLLGFRESSSIPGGVQNYDIENRFGFIGKYQFGEAALFDLGYYAIDNSDSNLFRNDWVGNWSGKGGISSKQDYLNNGAVQELIVRDWHALLWERIQFLGLEKYAGQTLNGQQITLSGMLAASHLIGAGSQSSEVAGLKGYLLSGAVFSPEDGNGTSANEFMSIFEGFQTPFFVGHSEAETIKGGVGRDVLTGFGGDDTLIGEGDIDVAVYGGQIADYEILRQSDEIWLIKQRNDGPDDADIVVGIERLQFSDQLLALDLNGSAGITAKTLGAVFGPESVSNQTFVGIGLNLLDDGLHDEALMQFAINAALGVDATSHAEVVDLLYENVVGIAPDAADQAFYIDLLDTGIHTVASIGVFAAETELNQENINLVGLTQTGLTYLLVIGS
ncbi:MAG: hypothetical protein NMNS01_14620 [Nitrosomonas sp.]|nr:MAG: hypothetical protein NMNS01_14620 [Nitrosomonas sp.]